MQALFRLYGMLLGGLAFIMIFPILVELSEHTKHWQPFAMAMLITGFMAGNMYVINRHQTHLGQKYIFLFTAGLWFILPIFAALPFIFIADPYHLNIIDAIFEAISGLTTTGSTVMSGLDQTPHGLLLWRSLLEWLGGIGIVVIAMVILPELRAGGMQLFRSESSDNSDKVLPKTQQVASATFGIYFFLTFCCTIAYYEAGMSGYEALNHAMATLSTGGFSTHDASMAYFNSLLIENIGTIFMLLGGIPMILYFSLFMGKRANAILLSQTKVYVVLCAVVSLVVAWWLIEHHQYEPGTAFTHAAFNVVSLVTTTGFASADYTQWGGFIIMLVYFLTITGGCTGSTSGGMKIFRFQVMAATLKSSFNRLLHPNGIFAPNIANKPISRETEASVKVFFLLFAIAFAVIALSLALMGLDIMTAFSAAATAIANVGPGLGEMIGPTGNFAGLPAEAKIVLAIAMIIGRLEILTVAVVLTPYFWREL